MFLLVKGKRLSVLRVFQDVFNTITFLNSANLVLKDILEIFARCVAKPVLRVMGSLLIALNVPQVRFSINLLTIVRKHSNVTLN